MHHISVDPSRRRGTPGSGTRTRRRYAAGVTAAVAAGLMLTAAPTAQADTFTKTIPGSYIDYVITPDSARVYALDNSDDVLDVIDTSTNRVTTTIDVGWFPGEVDITPDGTQVYVVSQLDDSVSVIDTATNTVSTTIAIEGGRDLAITPDGTRAYVASAVNETVSVIDTATNTVIATIDVADDPYWVAITPDGGLVRVTHYYDDTVSVIDTATNTLTDAVPVFPPYNGEITPDGTRAYFPGENSVVVKDTATDAVIERVELPAPSRCHFDPFLPDHDHPHVYYPSKIRITPDGTQAYVFFRGNIRVIAIGQAWSPPEPDVEMSLELGSALLGGVGSLGSLEALGSTCE
ncbi:beta-propeller fold lactonase family protein [Rhodococcus spongiicola]|nr:YncE family protein [Rhodococcus spongiicola]